MSVSRPFKWVCNVCTKTVEKAGYGLPSGWTYYGGTLQEPQIKHRCDECSKKEEKQ
jgi:hypothetical protein